MLCMLCTKIGKSAPLPHPAVGARAPLCPWLGRATEVAGATSQRDVSTGPIHATLLNCYVGYGQVDGDHREWRLTFTK